TYPYFSPSRPARVLQQLLFPRVAGEARFIAVADHVRTGLVAAGIRAVRIEVVPNGVPPLARLPASRDGPLVLGMLARLDPGKNGHVFVEAAASFRTTPGTRFVIGGVSSPFSEYEQWLRARAEAGGVEVVDASDGEAFLRALDVVAIPSAYEGSPLVLLEA